MSQFVPYNAKDISVERADRLACLVFDEGEPMLVLVAAAFFISLILLVPAMIEAARTLGAGVLHRKHDNVVQSSRDSHQDRDSGTHSFVAEEGSINGSKKRPGACG